MNPQDRLNLKKLMKQNEDDYEDNTDGIRRLKHSDLISADIVKMEVLKKEKSDLRVNHPAAFSSLCQTTCSFLYHSYTDIYNRVFKDELDLKLMGEALLTLKNIEMGLIDQQEGSILMGKLFYKVFVDSALKQREHLDDQMDKEDQLKIRPESEAISWKEYKSKK
jgi:hypothetical protein